MYEQALKGALEQDLSIELRRLSVTRRSKTNALYNHTKCRKHIHRCKLFIRLRGTIYYVVGNICYISFYRACAMRESLPHNNGEQH